MDIARSPQHDSSPSTNTTTGIDQKEDPMTESSIGHKRQAVQLADTTEKKRAKVTHGEAVATKARKRRKQKTNVTKGKRTPGAST